MQRLASVGRAQANLDDFMAVQDETWLGMQRCRERDECREKLVQLGILKVAE